MRQWPRFECVSRVHGPGVYGLETPDRSNRRAGKKIYASTKSTCGPPSVSDRAVPMRYHARNRGREDGEVFFGPAN